MRKELLAKISAVVLVSLCAMQAFAEDSFQLYTVWQRERWVVPDTNAATWWAARNLGLANVLEIEKRGMTQMRDGYPDRERTGGWIEFININPNAEKAVVRFHEIVDDSEYSRRVAEIEKGCKSRGNVEGATLTITGPAARRQFVLHRSWMEAKRDVFEKDIRGSHVRLTRVIHDENRQKIMVAKESTDRCLIRRDGDLMIEGNNQAVFNLPKQSFERPTYLRGDDHTVLLNLRDVPESTKNVAWNQISARLQTQMQQYDVEPDVLHTVRKQFTGIHHDLLRAALFDITNAWLSVQYMDQDKPIQGTAALEVEKRTNLDRILSECRTSAAHLPKVSSDDEFFRAECCLRLPHDIQGLLKALVNVVRDRLANSPVLQVLDNTVEDNVLELQLSGRVTGDQQFVGVGAFRITNAEDNLQEAAFHVLSLIPDLDVERIAGSDRREFLRIKCDPAQPWITAVPSSFHFVTLPEYVFLHLDGNVLWYCFGAESAWQVLADELNVQTVAESPVAAIHRPLISAKLNLEQAQWNEEGPSALATAMETFERYYADWLVGGQVEALNFLGRRNVSRPDRDALEVICRKALEGRPANAELTVSQQPNGLRLRFTIDRSLALLYWGRMAMSFADITAMMTQPPTRFSRTVADIIIEEEERRLQERERRQIQK